MLVVDRDRLRAVDLLNLVHEVALQLLDTENREDVVRIDRTVDQGVAGADVLALLHVDVRRTWHGVLELLPVVGLDDQLTHSLDDRAVMHDAVDLGDDRLLPRVTCLEELHYARQTARDVLRLGRRTRNLRDDVAGMNVMPLNHHQMGADRKQILPLLTLLSLDDQGRLALLGSQRLTDDHLGQTGDTVGLFTDVLSFDDVPEFDLTADLTEDGGGERIPLDQSLSRLDLLAFVDLQSRTVDDLIALLLATLVVDDDELTVTVDDDQIAVLVGDRVDVDELNHTRVGGFVPRLLGDA